MPEKNENDVANGERTVALLAAIAEAFHYLEQGSDCFLVKKGDVEITCGMGSIFETEEAVKRAGEILERGDGQ